MDRLHTVIALAAAALFAHGCNDTDSKTAAKSGRVNAVEVSKAPPKPATETAAQFCDVASTAADAPAFAYPELDGEAPAATDGAWRWVNVWATWCAPCIKELPLLQGFRKRLAKQGEKLDLVLVSVDESADVIAEFRNKHGGIPDTLRVQDPESVGAWLSTLGLDEGAPLPVHIFVRPDGKIRCLRAAGVDEDDFAAIAKLFE